MSEHVFAGSFSSLSQRLNTLDTDAWAVHDRALAMERAGEDVILLCVGDPDFRTPEPIIDNAVSHLRVGRTHYSPALGELKLRRAVADLETQTSPHPCSIDEVAIFPGATAAINAVMACLLDQGDSIVIPEPMYVGYPAIMEAVGARVTTVPLDVKSGFTLDVERVRAAIGAETRVLFLNTPGNPAGNIVNAAQIRDLAQYCRERDIWLVCDEVYSMFVYEGRHRSARSSVKHLDNIVMIDGLSKSHAMSGWRVGWVVAPPPFIQRLGDFASATQFGCPQFIQDASAFALDHDQDYVARMQQAYRERRDFVLTQLEKISALNCFRPRAGMFIMCDVSGTGLNGRQFAEQLLDAQKVSVVPGDAFGPSAVDTVRIGLAQDEAVLKHACKRIRSFCESIA